MIGIVTNVSQVQLGASLATDTALGATSLLVADTADLDEDGGTLSGPDGSSYAYSAVDADAGSITIAPGLVVDALEDDFFSVIDPNTGLIAVELRADVDSTATEGDDGDSISAIVLHVLQPFLPEGIRNPAQGEVVTVDQINGEWAITNIAGQTPQFHGDYLAPGTVPRGAMSFTFGTATVSIGDTEPTDPNVGDIWFDSLNGNIMKQWDGTDWQPYQWDASATILPGSVTGDRIAAGTVTADLIAANAIVAGAIAVGALDAFAITTGSLSAITMSGRMTGSVIDSSDLIIDDSGGRILVYQRASTVVDIDSGSGNWMPGSVGLVAGDTIKIECWGGGMGGAGGGSWYGGVGVGVVGDGVGGMGGHYSRISDYVLTAGDIASGIPYVVGVAGTAGTAGNNIPGVQGQPGGETSFGPVSAKGGEIWYGNGDNVGEVIFTSPGGGNLTGLSSGGTPPNVGGGGGSAAAGSSNNGDAGHTGSEGVGGVQPGGAAGIGANGGGSGGPGGASNAAGSPGVTPGGGGGGGGWVPGTSTGRAGADGASGRARLTYGIPVLLASISGVAGTDVYGNDYPDGIMAYPAEITDWDLATKPGDYIGISGLQTNSPNDSRTWVGPVYGRLATGTLVQVVNRLSTVDAPEMWTRQYSVGGGWRPWHQVY